MVDMQSYGKQGYKISTEKQETYNDKDEFCVHLFLLTVGTRTLIIQVINKNIVIATLTTKIPAFTSFRASNIRAHYSMSTSNISSIYCRATYMAGPGPDSDHKSILSKPLLQEKEKKNSGSRYMSMQVLTTELMYYLPM